MADPNPANDAPEQVIPADGPQPVAATPDGAATTVTGTAATQGSAAAVAPGTAATQGSAATATPGTAATPGNAAAVPARAVAQPAQAAPKPAAPKSDGKPAAKKPAAAAAAPAPLSRREFFPWLGAAWAAYTASFLAALGAMTRFMFPNVLFEPAATFRAGFPEEFSAGAVDERFKEKYGVWIVRDDEGIYALSTTCTHLGCTPNWLSNEGKFKCPCHGSGFYPSGINFEGPAPRPLERYRVVLAEDGQVLVDKTKKYQQEKGQWADPEAFLRLT